MYYCMFEVFEKWKRLFEYFRTLECHVVSFAVQIYCISRKSIFGVWMWSWIGHVVVHVGNRWSSMDILHNVPKVKAKHMNGYYYSWTWWLTFVCCFMLLLLAFFVLLAIDVDIAINSTHTKLWYSNVFAIKNALNFLHRVNTICCCYSYSHYYDYYYYHRWTMANVIDGLTHMHFVFCCIYIVLCTFPSRKLIYYYWATQPHARVHVVQFILCVDFYSHVWCTSILKVYGGRVYASWHGSVSTFFSPAFYIHTYVQHTCSIYMDMDIHIQHISIVFNLFLAALVQWVLKEWKTYVWHTSKIIIFHAAVHRTMRA